MPKYRTQLIEGQPLPTTPSIHRGGMAARRSEVEQILRAQDTIVGTGRRLVYSLNAGGAREWWIPDTDPASDIQSYPAPGQITPAGFAQLDLTPGHILNVSVLCLRSGETQIEDTEGDIFDFMSGGPEGQVRLTPTVHLRDGTMWGLGGLNIPIQASPLDFAAATIFPWAGIILYETTISPPQIDGNVANRGLFCLHSEVRFGLSWIASPRIIDLAVSETPAQITLEDEANDAQHVSHMLGSGSPAGAIPLLDFPFTRLSEAASPDNDRRGGTMQAIDVAQAQALRLGPHLMSWCAWRQDNADPTSTDLVYETVSSSSFVRLTDGESTAYNEDEPGWIVSSQARNYAENHPSSMSNTSSIPVIVAVYGRRLGGFGGGIVRVQSSEESWIDVAVSGATPTYFLGYGHLRVGQGAGDRRVLQVFARAVTGGILINSVSVHHAGQYQPASMA